MDPTGTDAEASGKATSTIFWRAFSRTVDADIDTAIDDNFAQQHHLVDNQFYQDLVRFQESTPLTFNDLVKRYTGDPSLSVDVYCVADGGFMQYAESNSAWFNPHVRFLVLVYQSASGPLKTGSWTHCIVGSWETDDASRFVQVASWDGTMFSFFSRENPLNDANQSIGWLYQGNSYDAFQDETAYLGPFNGHVNGTLVMKELKNPWLHWFSPVHTDVQQCFDPPTTKQLFQTSWISNGSTVDPLANCKTADLLETLVEDSIDSWMSSRKSADFAKSPDSGQLPQNVNVSRWMAHLLLNTTVNIQPGQSLEVAKGDSYLIPQDFFYNTHASQCGPILKNLPSASQYATLKSDYDTAQTNLGLALLQEVDPNIYDSLPSAQKAPLLYQGALGGGRETGEHTATQFAVAQLGEGDGPWTCLVTSYEDNVGVSKMQAISPGPSLLSSKFLQSIFMVDYANPVYSWRRGVLMQYCPRTTSPTPDDGYDLENTFVDNVRASSNAKTDGEPEEVFLKWWDDPREAPEKVAAMGDEVRKYLSAVVALLSPKSGPASIVTDYMKLTESRRRIYRPLPLDEFGLTLPFALNYPGVTDLPLLEMQTDGTVAPMPVRGQQFISSWTGTLWTYDPILLPTDPSTVGLAALASVSSAPVAPWLLPGKGKSLAICERTSPPSASRPRTCPVKRKRASVAGVRPAREAAVSINAAQNQGVGPTAQPVWNDILALFQAPYWISESDRIDKGKAWQTAMLFYGNKTSQGKPFDLWSKDCVQENVIVIYDHLMSRSMPITNDSTEFWPEAALETLRNWANQGFRSSDTDPIQSRIVIPQTIGPTLKIRTRKDIRSMSDDEINIFRAKLDDVLGCTVLGSKWQEICRLHGEWCLHYQEAFSLWHRAYLRYVEELIDFPIPYWNTFDPACFDPLSPAAGLPQAFVDPTYVHPTSGQIRPNPLLYALALDGKSTAGGQFIARDPILTSNDRTSPEFGAKVTWVKQYQREIQNALSQNNFSYAENVTTGAGHAFGVPWANLPSFKEDMADSDYVYGNKTFPYVPNFDGFFEQVHDNIHGWIGGDYGDMSDNTHTAADPIFLVYHANLDRVLDTYLSTHPQAQYTSNFPLRPFINNATDLSYTDPRSYVYSTIGDMAKDTRALNYIYAPPFTDDGVDLSSKHGNPQSVTGARRMSPPTRGGTAIAPHSPVGVLPPEPKLARFPQITFRDIVCTKDSYQIDVFAKNSVSRDPSLATNPAFLGRVTRLGMGMTDANDPTRLGPGNSRCRTSTVTRTLLLTDDRLTEAVVRDVASHGFVQVVTHMRSGKVVEDTEWKNWKGFQGTFEVGVAPEGWYINATDRRLHKRFDSVVGTK